MQKEKQKEKKKDKASTRHPPTPTISRTTYQRGRKRSVPEPFMNAPYYTTTPSCHHRLFREQNNLVYSDSYCYAKHVIISDYLNLEVTGSSPVSCCCFFVFVFGGGGSIVLLFLFLFF